MKLARSLREAWQRRVAAWIKRRQGADALPVTIARTRLYILPTRAGLGLGVLLLFMLLAGLNYGNNLALLATFLLMGFCIVGMNLCHRNLQGLRVVAVVTQAGFAGGFGRLELTLDAGGNEQRHAIAVDARGIGARAVQLTALGSARVTLDIPTPRRGRQRLERIRLSTTFPFGLARAWTWLHLPIEILVYPAPAGALPLPPARDDRDLGQGAHGPGNDEWSGIRPFRDGDSPRQVIWTAYAREMPLLVKEYAGTASERLHLDFERLNGLDAERRLQQICRWVLDAESRGAQYALALPGESLPCAIGSAHRDACLRTLALWAEPR